METVLPVIQPFAVAAGRFDPSAVRAGRAHRGGQRPDAYSILVYIALRRGQAHTALIEEANLGNAQAGGYGNGKILVDLGVLGAGSLEDFASSSLAGTFKSTVIGKAKSAVTSEASPRTPTMESVRWPLVPMEVVTFQVRVPSVLST